MFKGSSYILSRSPFSDICITNIFSHSGLPFHSLKMPFHFFSFRVNAFSSYLRNICLLQGHEGTLFCFLPEILLFNLYIRSLCLEQSFVCDVKLLVTSVVKAVHVFCGAGLWDLWQWTLQGPLLWKLWGACSCHGSCWGPWWQRLPEFSIEHATGNCDDTDTYSSFPSPLFLVISRHLSQANLPNNLLVWKIIFVFVPWCCCNS